MTAGRLVLPALRWRAETGFTHEAAAIDAALEFGAGGFILFGGTAEEVRDLTDRLRRDAGRPLLIAADLERGAGQQVRGLAELPPPLALSSLHEPAVIRGAGLLTAAEALSVGINWVLAPVADLDAEPGNPIVQTRSFGSDPAAVSAAVSSWIAGCEAGGALACAKHYPGHGRTLADSHNGIPVVDLPARELEADLAPFRAAVAAGVSSIMTAHVAYPGLDPTGTPATFSRAIVGHLREGLGFEGLVVTDALMMGGATEGRTAAGAALGALGAGVDLLLYPDDPVTVAEVLSLTVQREPEVDQRVREALGRYERALHQVEANRLPDVEIHAGSAPALGDWLLTRSVARGNPPRLQQPLDLEVVDDDLGGRWPPSSDAGTVAAALSSSGIGLGRGGSRILLVYCEARGFKGYAGLSQASRDLVRAHAPQSDLVVLFGHPRLAEDVPGDVPVLLAWHRQDLMQRAVARWLTDHLA